MKGVIFDVDGTLLDTMPAWETAGAKYLEQKGMAAEPDLRENLKVMSLDQAAAYFQAHYGIDEPMEQIVSDIYQVVADFYLYHAQPKAGVPEFLKQLRANGVRMCVATATDRKWIEPALARCGLLEYFGEIFTCASVGHGKDEPHIYEAAQQFLHLTKEEIWVFEDASHAAETAKKAGFLVCGVFDASECEQNKLREFSDIYLNSFEEAGGKFHEKGFNHCRV